MLQNDKRNTTNSTPMVFEALNYKLLAVGLFLVIAGFTAMYLENEVSGIISLFVSPIVIVGGYITVIFAIMKRTNQDNSTQSPNAN